MDFSQLNEILTPLSVKGIGFSLLCGAVVGFERQFSGKAAGIRTSILICLGSYVFVVLSTFNSGGMGDPSRVLGQIVTGIGFLGAGVMFTNKGLVVGVTSAATIWLIAAIGALIGFGNYGASILISVTAVVVLVGVNRVERWITKLGWDKDEDPEVSEKS